MKIIPFVAIFILLAVVGSMDYEDAEIQEAIYCANVSSGVWPAYNSDIDCSTEVK